MDLRHEKFRVKKPTSAPDMRNDVVRDPADPSSVDVVLKFTRHGPVLWEDGKRALALRWVGSEPGTAGYLASLAIDCAQNWEQFESAVARWKVPSENLVYADTEGNIGEILPDLPHSQDRPAAITGAGGTDWTGFVPVGELPHFFNPKRLHRHCRHKMIPDRIRITSVRWTSPYRIPEFGLCLQGNTT
jgi:penicillin amidase